MKNVLNFQKFNLSENLKYHLDNNISIVDNIFRLGSDNFYNLLKESRELFNNKHLILNSDDAIILETTDIGLFDYYNGELIPLDIPMFNENFLKEEAEYKGKEVDLNKPMRSSGPKKYKVYVKDPKTKKVKIVHFGDAKGGLKSKINDPEARKQFAQRHNCKEKKDKTKPGYWSCNLPHYSNLLGLSGGGNYFW